MKTFPVHTDNVLRIGASSRSRGVVCTVAQLLEACGLAPTPDMPVELLVSSGAAWRHWRSTR